MKKIGLNRTGINEVVGDFADCEGGGARGRASLLGCCAWLSRACNWRPANLLNSHAITFALRDHNPEVSGFNSGLRFQQNGLH